MALGALKGKAEDSSADGIDPIEHRGQPEFFRIHAAFIIHHGIAQEAGGDDLILRGVGEFIAGDLFGDEPVVGEIAIEGVDDVVAVGPDDAEFVALVAVGVGVAGDVEPTAGGVFAVMGFGEKTINLLFVGIGRGVGEKRIDLGGGGGKADEIQRKPAEQRGFVGFGRGVQAVGFESGENEGVDRVASPFLVFDGRQLWRCGRGEGPVILIGSPFGDPACEGSDLRRGELVVTVGRWHLFIGIGGVDAFDEFALVGFAGKDGGVAGFEWLGGKLAGVEAQAAFMFAGTVAAVTIFGEDRADVAGEIEGWGGCGRGGERLDQSGERE